jgi:hypothetical protein
MMPTRARHFTWKTRRAKRQHDIAPAVDRTRQRLSVHYERDSDKVTDTPMAWSVVELCDGMVLARCGAMNRVIVVFGVS